MLLPCPFCGGENLIEPTHSTARAFGFCSVGCLDCGVQGPRGTDESRAIHGWNSLPRVLRWSKEPPKVAGRYWTRFSDKTGKPRFLEIQEYDLKTAQGITEWEWAGPIPEPMEASDA